ncbi:FAD-dependent oxidoreductase [Conexibacter woesei]|uniref:ferredoxin--NADP(+) reductase n=1 Tax=Conexibacter woesei (strain DSM 14684 / CCUG 47730 / CIP 108061 / JCM 11494 / NBRC 100937 / ID131577) TaxID=469383 RepID=D3F5V5_CONWI|nr:FAD-dependent oxidoreductase [Conexibacter woesei]ADB52654.1 FAD-dependent pyridine nucleotide-disulphide oxidoreductase [Conexibacter woesei DSM 14684]
MATPQRVAVVGAGPAGFYTSDFLLQAGFEVDLFDALPTPFGLVRAGVAPDHPKIKRVTRAYERTARHPAFRFFGGVQLGTDVQREELLERYHAVVYAFGTSTDNRLGIPGEDRPGSHAATEFVAWYNGHPEHADREFDLSARRAVVIGNGNVAIDVARMLVLDPEEIAPTDTANHAIDALAQARVQEVVVLGRRGPAQAAFTNPELLELGELRRADVIVDPADVELDPHSAAWLASDAADQTHRRNVEILWEYAGREPLGKSHRVSLRFLRSPLEILGDADDAVAGLRVGVNRLEPDGRGGLRAVATGAEETIDCGLVLRSIGYRGVPLPGIPFDERRGLIRNDGGRVIRDDGAPATGEYAVGWIKRGPSGVIGTNKKDAHETVDLIVADRDAGRLGVPEPATCDGDEVAAWLAERVPHLVGWDGWRTIDAHERALGEPHSRPRVKLVRVPEMLEIAHGTPTRG